MMAVRRKKRVLGNRPDLVVWSDRWRQTAPCLSSAFLDNRFDYLLLSLDLHRCLWHPRAPKWSRHRFASGRSVPRQPQPGSGHSQWFADLSLVRHTLSVHWWKHNKPASLRASLGFVSTMRSPSTFRVWQTSRSVRTEFIRLEKTRKVSPFLSFLPLSRSALVFVLSTNTHSFPCLV